LVHRVALGSSHVGGLLAKAEQTISDGILDKKEGKKSKDSKGRKSTNHTADNGTSGVGRDESAGGRADAVLAVAGAVIASFAAFNDAVTAHRRAHAHTVGGGAARARASADTSAIEDSGALADSLAVVLGAATTLTRAVLVDEELRGSVGAVAADVLLRGTGAGGVGVAALTAVIITLVEGIRGVAATVVGRSDKAGVAADLLTVAALEGNVAAARNAVAVDCEALVPRDGV